MEVHGGSHYDHSSILRIADIATKGKSSICSQEGGNRAALSAHPVESLVGH